MLRTNEKLVSVSNYKMMNMFKLHIYAASFTRRRFPVICKVFRRQYEGRAEVTLMLICQLRLLSIRSTTAFLGYKKTGQVLTCPV